MCCPCCCVRLTLNCSATNCRHGWRADRRRFASEPFLLDVSALDDSVADALPQLCELLQIPEVRIIGVRHSSAAVGEQARALGWGGFRPSWNAHPRLLLNPPNPSAYPNPCLSPWRLSPSPRRKRRWWKRCTGKTLVVDRPARRPAGVCPGWQSGGAGGCQPWRRVDCRWRYPCVCPHAWPGIGGARGNVDARIFMQQMAAELVSIAGCIAL